MKPIVFGSRGSALALAQTKQVMVELQGLWPERTFELRIIKTQGDRLSEDPDRMMTEALGKGLFTAELERALLRSEIDLAVHSLKDLPTILADDGLILAAIPKREDPGDVLITRSQDQEKKGLHKLQDLPPNPKIATGSPRRSAQLKRLRPDAEIVPIRGNIDTRLRKFRENLEWSGLVLARAGLARLWPLSQPSLWIEQFQGLENGVLGLTEEFLPAPGQGALALQTRRDDPDTIALARALHDQTTEDRVTAERSFLRALGGGCQEPIAAHAHRVNQDFILEGIAWLNGETEPRRGKKIDASLTPQQLGEALARELIAQRPL